MRPHRSPAPIAVSPQDTALDDAEAKITFETLPVHKGTPRQLLFFNDQGERSLDQLPLILQIT
jgi:hypothetical protein